MGDFNGLLSVGDAGRMTLWHDHRNDNVERRIDTWIRKWRLAPEITYDSKGVRRIEGYGQYPARLLMPPCLVGMWMLAAGHGTFLGYVIAVLCVLLDTMLGAVAYCFAKSRVAALLPELEEDEIIRIAAFIMTPAFGIETLRIILAFVFILHEIGNAMDMFHNVTNAAALIRNPTEILTVLAFAIVMLRTYFSIRQMDRRRPARQIIANGMLFILALAVNYGMAGLGIIWGMCAAHSCRPG